MHRLQSLFHIKKIAPYRLLFIFSIVMVMCGSIEFSRAFVSLPLAHASTKTLSAACTSTSSTKPTSDSLLIVLLDRSGSLGIGSGSGTDTENYSASVTDALSDLWPGPMAVIPFYANGNQLIYSPIGPFAPGQRDSLKSQVNGLPSNGWTPLAEAMQAAQNLLKQNSAPSGSRIVVITDGQPQTPSDPTGLNSEEPDVLNKYAPQFCQEGVSVSPFGLTIPENSDPAHFLQQVAMKTGGTYNHVSNSTELAGAVIGLYAQWDGLEFNQIIKDQAHGYYPVITDSSVQSAYILTFYQSGQNEPLTTNTGQKVASTSSTDGRHYEIDTLSTPIPPAIYTERTSDPNAVVYVLDHSTRTLQLVQPTTGTIAQPGETLTIVAHLVDQGKGPHVPAPNEEIFFQATVTETVHGHTLPPVTVDFSQNQAGSDLFTGKFALPKDAAPGKQAVTIGTLTIAVNAADQGVSHTTSPLTIQVVIPKYVPPPPLPCHGNLWQCTSPQVHALAIGGAALLAFLLLLFLLFLWWRSQPAVYGTIYNIPMPRRGKSRPDPEDAVEVHLGSKRTLRKRLLSRALLTSEELTRHPDAKGELHFDMARFELIARRGRSQAKEGSVNKKGWMMCIRPAQGNVVPIKIRTGSRFIPITGEVPLESNSTIIVNEQPKASYS